MKVYLDAEYHCHATNTDGIFRETLLVGSYVEVVE